MHGLRGRFSRAAMGFTDTDNAEAHNAELATETDEQRRERHAHALAVGLGIHIDEARKRLADVRDADKPPAARVLARGEGSCRRVVTFAGIRIEVESPQAWTMWLHNTREGDAALDAAFALQRVPRMDGITQYDRDCNAASELAMRFREFMSTHELTTEEKVISQYVFKERA